MKSVYMTLVGPSGSVFVKELEFFKEQCGFLEPWGQNWVPVIAEDCEDARAKRSTDNTQMSPAEYVNNAIRTESRDFQAIALRTNQEIYIRLLHAAIGMGTESGEFLDQLKRAVFYGKAVDRTNLIEELGDMLWYVAIACDTLDISLGNVMAINIAKLKARYPNKFTEQDAIVRNLDAERKVLEGENEQ